MDISIIIVTYNSLEYIKTCIDSILSSIGSIKYEIIIVDNSSENVSNKTKDYVRKLYGSKVTFIKNENNLGYGQGNNLGIKRSKSEHICIMNPDIILCDPNIFENALMQFKNNDRLGMLGYKQLGGHNLTFYIRQEFSIPILSAVIIKIANKLNYFNSKFMYLSGALFFTSRKSFEDIGLFDENIFLYNEESDITKRFHRKKYKIKYIRSIKYIHNINNRKIVAPETFKEIIKSALYYLNKYSFSPILYIRKGKMDILVRIFYYKLFKKKNYIENCKMKIELLNIELKKRLKNSQLSSN
jgi:GT2 family glycosyltransferase